MKKQPETGQNESYYTFQVDKDDTGRRIDRVIRKILSNTPLSGIYKLIRNGKIKINGKKFPPSYRLVEGDTISLPKDLTNNIPTKTNKTDKTSSIKPFIIEETEDFIAINKPRGVLVHGKNSLDTMLLNYLNNTQEEKNPFRAFTPGPIHRLDRNTSGIVIFSKSLKGAKEISILFKEHRVTKIYLAVIEGKLTRKATLRDILYRDKNKKKSIVGIPHTQEESPKGENKNQKWQEVITHLYPLVSTDKLTLTLCIPVTGKSHQIRAQLANYGHPLLGDIKYGGRKNRGGFLLHALQIIVKGKSNIKGLKNLFAPLPKESYIMIEDYFGRGCLNRLEEKIRNISKEI